MADREHLNILQHGVAVWNQWREDNPKIVPDLSNANLSGKNLKRIDLSLTNLTDTDFTNSELVEATFKGANLFRADFINANLFRAYLVTANLTETTFLGTDLYKAYLNKSDLSEAKLGRANLAEASLVGANLFKADLHKASLIRADLSEANIREALIVETNLSGANLTGAHFDFATVRAATFANVDLSVASGLDTIRHWGPSSVGIDTLYLSKGNIPEIFLRGAGVPETFIAYMHSLTAQPIQFYSCFISYSSKDQKFADRLYADLQVKGVRSWFAPEDLKWGDKLRLSIDESIRIHDKLLVVLSKHSIASEWVEKEVETAMERERLQKRIVLFPIRLDDEVLKVESGWAADIRRSRNIGDFRRWKTPDSYHKSFNRLLNDLKASDSLENAT